MKIKEILDVITNSSSEVFVIKTDRKLNSDPMKMILNVCNSLGLEAGEIMTWGISKKDGLAVEGWPESKCQKGDLVIESIDDNSIPFPLQDLIEGLTWFDPSIKSIKRIHLG